MNDIDRLFSLQMPREPALPDLRPGVVDRQDIDEALGEIKNDYRGARRTLGLGFANTRNGMPASWKNLPGADLALARWMYLRAIRNPDWIWELALDSAEMRADALSTAEADDPKRRVVVESVNAARRAGLPNSWNIRLMP